MIRLVCHSALILGMALAPWATHCAADILDHVPRDAMSVAVVRDIGATNAKIEQLIGIFAGLLEVTPPAPLTVVRAATGLGDGLDEAGDALLALLPGAEGAASPRPLLIVAVSDYARFAASVDGDATGNISRVTIAGEEVLLGKKGPYAVLMNVEHRPTMETLLAASPQALPELAALDDWLAANDVAVVLLPTGVELLTEMGRAGLAMRRTAIEQQFSGDDADQIARQLSMQVDLSDWILRSIGEEFRAAAVGVAVDAALNVRVATRLLLKEGGQLAILRPVPKLDAPLLAGYPAGPFVAAAGGPMPQGYGEAMAKVAAALTKQYPEVYGFEKLDESQYKKIEESWKSTTVGLRSFTSLIQPGARGEPLFGNIYSIIKVDDAPKYLENSKRAMELWNELTDASTSDIKFKYEFAPATIEGKQGLSMSADVAAAAGDENVPMVRPMFEAMFGADAKMRMYWIAADANTVVMGMGTEANVAKAIQWNGRGEQGLAQSPEIEPTASLLNAEAPWQAYFSPPGFAQWITRFIAEAFAPLGAAPPAIPEYPPSPPLAFSLHLADGQFQSEAVVPVKALKSFAIFIKKVQDMNL